MTENETHNQRINADAGLAGVVFTRIAVASTGCFVERSCP